MTASILARDAQTSELGVAVFTDYPSVGMRVPFAEPGVGVVATQGLTDRSFGPRALRRLRAGASAAQVVEELIGADPAAAANVDKQTIRQLRADAESFVLSRFPEAAP